MHWARMTENTFAFGITFLYMLHKVFGRTVFRLVLLPVVAFYWICRPDARHASRTYLARLQTATGAPGHVPGHSDTFRHLFRFADTLLDKLLATAGHYPDDRIRLHGAETVRAALREGRGGVIVTAHVGCLELCRALANHTPGIVVNVLVHTRHARRFNDLLDRLDPAQSIRLLEVTDISPATAADLSARVMAGELIAIAGDRVPLQSERTVSVPFLGHPASFPIGPYLLGHLLQCPVYLMCCLRENAGYALYFERLAERIRLPRQNREEAIKMHAGQFATSLTGLLGKSPYDWFNFFPFWDDEKTHEHP